MGKFRLVLGFRVQQGPRYTCIYRLYIHNHLYKSISWQVNESPTDINTRKSFVLRKTKAAVLFFRTGLYAFPYILNIKHYLNSLKHGNISI